MPHASQVPITGRAVVAACWVAALVAVVLVPLRWDHWGRRRWARTVTVVLAVALVLAACAVTVNRLGSFYPTLGALIGTSSDPAQGADAEGRGDDVSATRGVRVARSRDGRGTTVHVVVDGRASGLRRDVDVYLPAGYDAPGSPDGPTQFPVVEWMPGFPGEPREVAALFGLPQLLDTAIAQGRMPPTVVVVPDTNGEPRLRHDEECVDAVGGIADDTFLSTDVRDWALATLHVRPDRDGWALAGWSSGGYCAMNLALRHPQWYATAASQSGSDAAAHDVTTGDLFAGRDDVRRANDVGVLLREHPAPTAVLATAGAGERDEQAALGRLRAAAAPPTSLDTITFPGGGHNADAVRAQLPAVVDWLGRRLPAPVVPGPATPGATRTRQGVAPWPLPR